MTQPARAPVPAHTVRALRPGHGANCSSIGSVVDTLFVTSLVGGALFAAVVASLGHEPVEVIGERQPPPPSPPAGPTNEAAEPPR